MYRATTVPVGADQVPHVELTREIARRFNHVFGDVFPEPQALLAAAPRVPGLDGRKMSKSYNNAVFLADDAAEVKAKLSRMMTDPRRARRRDPGDPDDCPAYTLHRIYCTPDELDYTAKGCRSADIGCLECKHIMIARAEDELGPIRERRRALAARPDDVRDVIVAAARAAPAPSRKRRWPRCAHGSASEERHELPREARGLRGATRSAPASHQEGGARHLRHPGGEDHRRIPPVSRTCSTA